LPVSGAWGDRLWGILAEAKTTVAVPRHAKPMKSISNETPFNEDTSTPETAGRSPGRMAQKGGTAQRPKACGGACLILKLKAVPIFSLITRRVSLY